jgi:DNA (cytosine-5)-methyltransferase 1
MRRVLAVALVEWMMGLPAGWVTGVDIPRNAKLRLLGNGVVPPQATAAVQYLLNRTEKHS